MKQRANSAAPSGRGALIQEQPSNDERLAKSKNGENLAHSGKQGQADLGGAGNGRNGEFNDLQHIA